MATPKNVWNNSAEMHKVIANESPEYFNDPEPKEVKEVQPDGSIKTYYEMPPSQFAIDAILNEARINRLNGGSQNVSF
tara:strand:+ start:329 stop:562 length:234 start_codon:yes stop_codon:yes gene_type:complete